MLCGWHSVVLIVFQLFILLLSIVAGYTWLLLPGDLRSLLGPFCPLQNKWMLEYAMILFPKREIMEDWLYYAGGGDKW
jgi:hypothetical protein